MLHLLSLDIETTGLDPKKDQILEVALVYSPLIGERTTFHALVDNGGRIAGDPFALAMNSAVLYDIAAARRVQSKGEKYNTLLSPINELSGRIYNFLINEIHLPEGEKFTVCGKNVAGFDIPFLKSHNCWEMRMCHHRCLDIGTLFWVKTTDTCLPDLKTCIKRAGLPDRTLHRALDDANAVLDCIDTLI